MTDSGVSLELLQGGFPSVAMCMKRIEESSEAERKTWGRGGGSNVINLNSKIIAGKVPRRLLNFEEEES